MAAHVGADLRAHANATAGPFLGRKVAGLPGPIWSMMAWYLLITGFMLASAVRYAISPNDVAFPGLIWFQFAYCLSAIAALRWLGARTPIWALLVLVDLNIIVTSVSVALRASELAGAVLLTLVVAAVYVATWFQQREMVAHLVLLTVVSAVVVFVLRDSPGLRVLWAAIIGLCWGLGFFVNRLIRDLHQQVMSDPLTGLLNRSGLELAAAILSGERAQVLPRSVAVLDLDNFKAFNDRGGHLAGDEVLRDVGATLRSQLRTNDTPARTGGDEFVVLMPFTNVEQARSLIARVIPLLPISCSFGIADWPAESTFDQAVAASDRDMYAHKRHHNA